MLLLLTLSRLAYLVAIPAPAQSQTSPYPPATSPPAQTQPQSPAPPLMIPFTPPPKPAAPAPPAPLRTLILLDPAHGGPDTGAHLSNNLPEKDITLAFAARLRAILAAGNFAVISTRTADPATLFTTDQRAEIANHDRPAVCLILHATSSGSGVHIFTSALTPPTHSTSPAYLLHWNAAQVPALPRSLALADEIAAAFRRDKLPVLLSHATVPPLDNLTCPAIAIELAPLDDGDSTPTPVSDAAYQQRAVEAIAKALTDWRTENTPTGAAR